MFSDKEFKKKIILRPFKLLSLYTNHLKPEYNKIYQYLNAHLLYLGSNLLF